MSWPPPKDNDEVAPAPVKKSRATVHNGLLVTVNAGDARAHGVNAYSGSFKSSLNWNDPVYGEFN